MMSLRHAWILLLAVPFIGACETKPSNVERHFGNAVSSSKELMIASAKQEGAEPMGMSGPTATGVARNYHWNQRTESRGESSSSLLRMRQH
jgi:hypothetical protein